MDHYNDTTDSDIDLINKVGDILRNADNDPNLNRDDQLIDTMRNLEESGRLELGFTEDFFQILNNKSVKDSNRLKNQKLVGNFSPTENDYERDGIKIKPYGRFIESNRGEYKDCKILRDKNTKTINSNYKRILNSGIGKSGKAFIDHKYVNLRLSKVGEGFSQTNK